MHAGDQITFRCLPDGNTQHGSVNCVQEKRVQVDFTRAADLKLDTPVELQTGEALYLGIVEQVGGGQFWVCVEHYLNRKALAGLQAVWGGSDQDGSGA